MVHYSWFIKDLGNKCSNCGSDKNLRIVIEESCIKEHKMKKEVLYDIHKKSYFKFHVKDVLKLLCHNCCFELGYLKRKRIPTWKTCGICGKTFETVIYNQKTCDGCKT